MNKKVKIFADSSCDLSPELIKRYNVGIVPLYITCGEDTFRDNDDITVDGLFAYVKQHGKLPKTSAPPPADYINFFQPFIDADMEIVYIALNSGFSASYQNACIAANKLPNIHIIDSQNISSCIGLLVIKASEMADEGKSASEIAQYIESIKHTPNAVFVLDRLDYAAKGGRCSILTAFGANLLRLRPCLEVKKGVLSVGKKFRGSFEQVALEYTKYVLSFKNIDFSRLFISYTAMSKDILDKVIETVKSLTNFKEIFITRTGCTIATHGGPNTLAVFYLTK